MGLLARDIAELSLEQRVTFESWLQKKRNRVSAQICRRKSGHDVAPLSFAQQRLWFLDQLNSGLSAYNMPAAIRLTGPLNVPAMEQSLNEIIRRHEILRTTFTQVNGQPVQVIASSLTLRVPLISLQAISEPCREIEVKRLAREEAQQPFDLAQGPLLRLKLLHLGEADFVVLLTMSHLISDGWSLNIFIQELAALYEAFSNGRPSPLPQLPIQYADFAIWQREFLQGETLEQQLTYWKNQLAQAPFLELTTDWRWPSVQDYRGACQSLTLSPTLTGALKALSQRENVTPFMLLLTAFSLLLSRHSGQDDIVIGTPTASRTRVETEGLIGLFVSTLVLRTHLSGDPSFRQLLEQTRQVTLAAYTHQDLPFEKLVEELKLERDLNRNPLFEVFFNSDLCPSFAAAFSGLTLQLLDLIETDSKFMITLRTGEFDGQIRLRLEYRRALFSDARMVSLLNQYRHLLEQVAAAPQDPISSYSLVTPETQCLLPDMSATLPEPHYPAVPRLFEAWAQRAPHLPAICCGGRVWTYGQLAHSAYVLAQVLLTHGLERGQVVAVLGSSSYGTIASMLAVLFGGGVLLGLDRRLPVHRRELMLQESRASYLLCVGERRFEDEWLQGQSSLIVLNVDPGSDCPVEPREAKAVPLPQLAPDDAAYVSFTSGTTRVPKGVLGCHKGLSHFLNWQRETFSVDSQDRFIQLTSLSFDVIMRDVFLPLSSGSSLYLLEEPEDLGPDKALTLMESARITMVHLVPTLAQSWLADVPSGISLRALRYVFFAGEPLTDTLVTRWRGTFPQAGGLINLYGPAETTLAKCYYQVPSTLSYGIQPIGHPLPETQALVLAPNNRLCGIGESGEIVIRTPFRTHGYVNAPQEQQQRFVPNPFRDDPRDLLYYSGDAGSYRVDGSLSILGRLDHRFKIRGVTVDPDEVTATLFQHPMVRSCIVVPTKDSHDQISMVAYVVPTGQGRVTNAELRAFLSKQLLPAMIPSTVMLLDSLPLGLNGKVDRRALPAPDHAQVAPQLDFVAPRTPIEKQIAKTWTEVLGVEPIGLHSNFFELGGHSLSATQAASRLRNTFKLEVSLRHLLETPTIAGWAEAFEQTSIKQADPQEIASALDMLKQMTEEEVQEMLQRDSIRP